MKTHRKIVFSHLIAFIFFLILLPPHSLDMFGESTWLEETASISLLLFLVSYGITQKMNISLFLTGLFIFVSGLKQKYKESFEVKPPSKNTLFTKNIETEERDNTHFDPEALDTLLKSDDQENDEDEQHDKKLFESKDFHHIPQILKQAQNERHDYHPDDLTPSQAQKKTYHLIDTIKQLKETMTEMVPLMKAGNNLLGLYKKINNQNISP